MEIFRSIAETLRLAPDWVPLVLLPALLVPAALSLALTGQRRRYPLVALVLGACGVLFTEESLAVFYASAFCIAAVLVSPFLLIPRVSRRKRARPAAQRALQPAPVAAPAAVPTATAPPAPPASVAREAHSLQLAHVRALIDKLRAAKLSAADRLETDAIAHSLEGYGGRELTWEEAGFLNDRLASVLKLTAKYKL